jgi:predicted NodU family carbamoyl transferase
LYILGINAYHGDASAAIVRDGELLAAAEEERFNRRKHCARLPVAAGDNGTAIGVCYLIYNEKLGRPRSFVMDGAYTVPEFSDDEIRAELKQSGLVYESYSGIEVTRRAAQDIADRAVVGWFQGRMEFGPRALGKRSIVADPRRADMEGHPERAHQEARIVPPVRAPHSRRTRRRLFRADASRADDADGLSGA